MLIVGFIDEAIGLVMKPTNYWLICTDLSLKTYDKSTESEVSLNC